MVRRFDPKKVDDPKKGPTKYREIKNVRKSLVDMRSTTSKNEFVS